MPTLLDAARRTIRRFDLLPKGARAIVALSGGADSVALLVVLQQIASSDGFHLAGAVHLNHQLRGADADADEEFCRQLCADLGVPLHIERIDIASLARAAGVSVEHAAHDARHDLFARSAARVNASAVAVAHTKDDQAETFLLRMLRGAGPRGLSGMHPRVGLVVRPFLETTRSEVRAFLHARAMVSREDTTNDDRAIPRNRVRHELLPLLQSHFSPAIVDTLAREAAIAREDAEYLDAVAAAAAERLIVRTGTGIRLPAAEMLAQPPAIARRVIRLAVQMASDGRFVGFDAVEAVFFFAASNSTGPLDLPGARVNRLGDALVLTKSVGRPGPTGPAEFAYQLGVPGNIRVPEAGCEISADISTVPPGRSAAEVWTLVGRGDAAVLDARRLTGPLLVRNRRPGDRFRPLGLGGRKKLQDLFVDAKIGRAERDAIPLVVDSDGQIVWVVGHAVAEDFRVTDRTTAVVILRRVPI